MMFSIGEFSKIAQVPGSLLRYYDQIGLFVPDYTDPFTGYRNYSARQLPRLNRILALKELGLSLHQIARLLDDDVSPEEIRGMFMLKKAQVEQHLYEEMARLRMIESRLQYIDCDDEMHGFDVVVKSVPAQPFLSVRDTYRLPTDALAVVAEVHRLLPEQVGEKALGLMIAVVYDELFALENIDIEIGFPYLSKKQVTIALPHERKMTVRELPAIDMAVTTVWPGGHDRHLSYGALGLWMDANHYRFDGPPREVLLEPLMPDRLQEATVEIQFPVKRTDPLQGS
jgi:DNA-binding transcriptional MerR regulator/effector-binding domain-containing protein